MIDEQRRCETPRRAHRTREHRPEGPHPRISSPRSPRPGIASAFDISPRRLICHAELGRSLRRLASYPSRNRIFWTAPPIRTRTTSVPAPGWERTSCAKTARRPVRRDRRRLRRPRRQTARLCPVSPVPLLLWSTVASVIAQGRIGRVTLAQFSVPDTAPIPAARLAARPATRPRGSTGPERRGIPADTGAHYFYLVQQLFGLPRSVQADLRRSARRVRR